jgi:SAM-dependent methyltransferase
MSRPSVTLLPREALIKTNPLDQAEWNYQGALGAIQRRRFEVAVHLIGPGSAERLLEVGYGSGIFMPELSRHCTNLYGIDTHDKSGEVTEVLAAHGVTAQLRSGSVLALPYDDGFFDQVVTVSSLEFVDDIEGACRELARVACPGGALVVVTPGYGAMLDLGLKVLTGERAEDTFQGRRQRVVPALERHFRVEAARRIPPVPRLWLYTVLRLRLS